MIALTGPPRIAGIDRRYPSLTGWMECVWDDGESVWRTYGSGRRELVEARYRLRGSCAWELATEQEALALVSDLRGVFTVAPRTRAAGDPDWAEEVEVPCRRTTPLPATRPVYLVDEHGARRWRVAVEFESAATFGRVPGTASGGYLLTGETAESVTIEPYGDATLEPGAPLDVVFTDYDGSTETVPVETYRLGSDAVAAARTEDLGDTIRIHTLTP